MLHDLMEIMTFYYICLYTEPMLHVLKVIMSCVRHEEWKETFSHIC